jgi:hypothetical protein
MVVLGMVTLGMVVLGLVVLGLVVLGLVQVPIDPIILDSYLNVHKSTLKAIGSTYQRSTILVKLSIQSYFNHLKIHIITHVHL